MDDKKIVKTIRFSEHDYKLIEDFLNKNPALDFSTLIRLSLTNFLISPSLNEIDKSLKKEGIKWN